MKIVLKKIVGPREKKIAKASDKQVKEKYSLSYFFFSLCLCFLVGFNVLLTAGFINRYSDYLQDYKSINNIVGSYDDSKAAFLTYSRSRSEDDLTEFQNANASIFSELDNAKDSMKADRNCIMMYRIVYQMLEHRQELMQEYVSYGRVSISEIEELNFQIERNLNLLTTYYIDYVSVRFSQYAANIKRVLIVGNIFLVVITVIAFMLNTNIYRDFMRTRLENEMQKRHIAEAKMHELQMQMNPHFLFNTLSLVIRNIQMGEGDTAIRLVKATSQLLRRSIAVGNDTITMDEELELLEKYLFIQKIHCKGRISIKLDVRKSYMDEEIRIPPLIIQPLVENAIQHGLKDTTSDGQVNVFIEEKADMIRVQVQDNGCGVPEEVVNNIMGHVPMKRIGLSNVYERLCFFYHRDDCMKIESSPEGTLITLYLYKEVE
ncbi:sensor histidine kinase [Butyrivibrio sp. INlla21]|uniref:sensor histidine kinase n=1 Tax=Butyrivibrio sp. INlla21 TaxID=1520811 RepID=UPI0008E76F6E|nr:histidine kinase [Butyrivibrio sp. INlla21]SFU83186.1 Histidine kinase-, DNA gyrase B-, and HSP90-like ATPase [Butyrivibrio sp. INlla21]